MSIVTCEYCSKRIDSDIDLDCFTNEGIACKACRWWDIGISLNDEAAGQALQESDVDLAARLMRFYGVDSLHALVRAQNRHVEKLQERIPSDGLAAIKFMREA